MLTKSFKHIIKPDRFRCDITVAVFLAAIIGMVIGANAKKAPPKEQCFFDQTFNRWECCIHTVETTHGTRCAVGQPIRIMINPL